jgi:hypothetical protein
MKVYILIREIDEITIILGAYESKEDVIHEMQKLNNEQNSFYIHHWQELQIIRDSTSRGRPPIPPKET